MNVSRILDQARFFEGISRESKEALSRLCMPGERPKNTTLFREGEPGEAMYLQARGRVSLHKMSPDGRQVLRISGQSDHVVAGGIDWSPDGRWIAHFSRTTDGPQGNLRLVSAEGGEARQVCQVSDVRAHSDVSWSPDGRELAFVSRGKIWVVPASGGEPVEVKTDVDAAAGTLDWSPDGRKLVFSGESGMENEFWFMENFLPLANEAAAAPAQKGKK